MAGLAGELPWPDVEAVGGWWNRRFDPEVDLVGADRAPVARRLFFAGSVKWLGSRFDRHDLAALWRGAASIPGFRPDQTGLVIVSLAGTSDELDLRATDLPWGPANIVAAWVTPG